jgi:hypothetical protein
MIPRDGAHSNKLGSMEYEMRKISSRRRAKLRFAVLAAALMWCAAPALAKDRHAGYYYPKVNTTENYVARAKVLGETNRSMRIGFIVAQTLGQREAGYPPRFAIFAKGDEAEKLIIIGMGGGGFATLYRARGVLAQLTAISRSTELFRELAVEDIFTFFDLARMLGFEQITISDGNTYAHRVNLK